MLVVIVNLVVFLVLKTSEFSLVHRFLFVQEVASPVEEELCFGPASSR